MMINFKKTLREFECDFNDTADETRKTTMRANRVVYTVKKFCETAVVSFPRDEHVESVVVYAAGKARAA